ncbi:MAG: wax ester/triacylglycerol synthase family O-acyltransferase [Myxococcota bacterium]
MQQLTTQDAIFLSMETPELPGHIGGLAFLAPTEGHPFSYATFVDFVRERLGSVDRFSWRLQEVPFGLDRPYWVTCRNFDPADHVHSVRIPEPYSDEELAKLVGRIFERPMDRAQPLWDIVLIEGLPGGRYAMLWRMHHCLMDGASGANVSEQLFDLSPDAQRDVPAPIADAAEAGEPVSDLTMWANAARNASELPLRQGKLLGRLIEGARRSRNDAKAAEKAAARKRTRKGAKGRKPANAEDDGLAPPALWNGVVGPHRRVAWTSISLDQVKQLKNTLGVTVNDVVLGITGGAARDYLRDRGALPEKSLLAMVPCSTRKSDDKALGNNLTDLAITWGTDLADPIERIAAIHEHASEAKARAQDDHLPGVLEVIGEVLLPGAANLFARGSAAFGDKVPLPTNAVVSNVPMTPFPLYVGSARIEQMVPVSLLGPTQGINLTLLSYCGQIYFGLVYDPDLMPDAWEFVGRIPKNLLALQEAVSREFETGGTDGLADG